MADGVLRRDATPPFPPPFAGGGAAARYAPPAFPDPFAGGAAAFPTDAFTPPFPSDQRAGGGAASPFAALQTVLEVEPGNVAACVWRLSATDACLAAQQLVD